MKPDKILFIFAVVILLIVNILTFHDIFETHTARDWLLLLASILVVLRFLSTLRRKNSRQ